MKRTKGKSPPDKSLTLPPIEVQGYTIEVMFDLDGVLAEPAKPFHHIGEPIPEMVELLKYYVSQGQPCSLYTSRPESQRGAIEEWLYYHNLHDLLYQVICDKPVFGLLIDDRSWNPWLTTQPSKTRLKKSS